MFLFDGYDEVTAERRDDIAKWISDLGRTFVDSRIFVSTRPYASEDLSTMLTDNGLGFNDLYVDPMDLLQINEFIDHWYRAYSYAAADQEQLERLRAAKERLQQSISASASIRAISNNPLLCALICFVNADREGFVPYARGDLYSIAAETLLERREKERQVAHHASSALTKNQKFKIMGFIAEYFFMRRRAQLPILEIEEHLKDFLPALGIDADLAGPTVQYLVERSHILRSPDIGSVDFSHRTFQEYFYARRIVDLNLREMIFEEFFSDDIAEVILFTCAIAPSEFVESVIGSALENLGGARSVQFRDRLIFLYSCMTEAAEISPDVRTSISSKLDAILPPRNLEEAESIGSAGRSMIEPLAHFAEAGYQKYWSNCAAALISTFDEEALPALSRFALLGSCDVDNILMKGKRYFESKKYNSIVLAKCTTITKLIVKDSYDYDLLNVLPAITEVEFIDYDGGHKKIDVKKSVLLLRYFRTTFEKNIVISKYFPNARNLEIVDCYGIGEFTDIKSCKKLRKLKIWSDELSSISFLDGMKELVQLDLSESVNLEDVEVVNRLPGITTAILPYAHLYDGLSPRLRMEDVEVLDLDFDEGFL